jgi:hypothetical protein
VTAVHNEAPPATIDRRSLLARARGHDADAVVTMFRQFVPADEDVVMADYLGTQGLWGVGLHSFGCVTHRRVCGLRIGLLGHVVYQDCELEHVNSGAVLQPSLLWLYLWSAVLPLLWIGSLVAAPISVALTLALSPVVLLVLPLWVRVFYGFHKSGMVLVVREGLPVYLFSNRSLQRSMNAFYRETLAIKAHARRPHAGSPAQARPAEATVTPTTVNGGAAVERQATRARVRPISVVLAGLGGAAVIAAIFLPIYGATGADLTVKLFDNDDKATVWLALEPLVLGFVPLLFAAASATGRVNAEQVWLWLIALGVQAMLFALGHLGFAVFSEGLSPEVGAFLLLAGGLIVTTAGILASDTAA